MAAPNNAPRPSGRGGPLAGIRVVEIAGLGPGPFCAMLLADMGATVLRVERGGQAAEAATYSGALDARFQTALRSREVIGLDLKHPAQLALLQGLIARADVLIEGFRPGVMERLGLGPDALLQRNPRLVYGRMTGWGQQGPLAPAAGHDLNYIALTGALHAIGRRDAPPTPPLNLLGDYGGGATYLAMGILAALLERQHSGCGQVVDAAIVDGVLSLMTPMYGTHAAGAFHDERGTNLLDSGVFFYDVYQCQDGLWLSVACLEEKFYRELLQRLEVDPATMPPREDRQRGEEGRARLARIFLGRTRAQWTALLEGTDVCFAPVLTLAEAPTHPHLAARQAFITVDGVPQPAPAPRFSRTPSPAPTGPRAGRFPSDALLDDWGTSLAALQQAGVVVP